MIPAGTVVDLGTMRKEGLVRRGGEFDLYDSPFQWCWWVLGLVAVKSGLILIRVQQEPGWQRQEPYCPTTI